MKRCGVCGRKITFLVGDADALQQDLHVDVSEHIKPIEDEAHAEYVCKTCVLERVDAVIQFLTQETMPHSSRGENETHA